MKASSFSLPYFWRSAFCALPLAGLFSLQAQDMLTPSDTYSPTFKFTEDRAEKS